VGLDELEDIAGAAALLPTASRPRAQARDRARSTARTGTGTREAVPGPMLDREFYGVTSFRALLATGGGRSLGRALARATILAMAAPLACARPATPSAPRVEPPPLPTSDAPSSSTTVDHAPPSWPEPLASALAGRGTPHAQPISLPRDARGRERWLAFIGTSEVALGAWHVVRAPDGVVEAAPVARWPAGVRVVGGFGDHDTAYVLLESLGVLDQPPGLRAAWIDGSGRSSPFEASPLALSDVADVAELGSRVRLPPQGAAANGGTAALLATLHAASGSSETLVHSLSARGADIGLAWQSLFVERVGHISREGTPPGPLVERALAIVRDALGTQACGPDTCEAWSDRERAVVRFSLEDGRWVLRDLIEDAPVSRPSASSTVAREVEASAGADATAEILRARVREVRELLGEAPLTADGGTIGVALTDAAPDAPCVVVREGASARLFALDVGAVRAQANEVTWTVGFADVDGDGRTDVALRMNTARGDGSPLAWTQVFLAPPPSIQASSVDPDLASALAAMNAPDARSAARAAASLPTRGVSHDEACRLLATASTPAGFRRVSSPDARLLLFQEPGRPTWRPKVVTPDKVVADDVRRLSAHCAELSCSSVRPYCSWASATDSEHAWFGWRDGKLEIVGAADYDGE